MGQLRKSKIDKTKIQEILAMRRNGIKMACIAYDLNISIGSVHKYLRLFSDGKKKL